jgi:glucose/arabinose dehydrogenase
MKKNLLIILSLLSCGFLECQTPAFTKTTVVTGLAYPVAFDVAPDGRFFLTQKGGNSAGSCANGYIKVYDANGVFLANFYNLTDSVQCDFERGLLGIVLDPNFATNHYVYAYYNHLYNGDERIRVVKFTEASNIGTNPQIILDIDVSNSIAGNHVGGNVRMHASEPNKIYVTIGDIAVQANGQTLTDPYGAFLRINTDGTIPTDNPFYDDGNPLTGNDDRVWTYGHRNPFDFNFSPVNDSLYSSENGLNTWDELNQIHRGGNYGWRDCEGFYNYASTSTLCTLAVSILPIEDWAAPLPAVTGIIHYSGTVFPTLTNHMLVADNDVGNIYDITLGNAPAYDQFVSRTTWADFTTSGGLTTLHQGADECVYAMKGGYTTNGQIYRICPVGMSIEENNVAFGNIAVFPNPASENFTLNFAVSGDSKVQLEFFDITGRLVATTNQTQYKAGNVSITLNKSAVETAKGILFCRINCVSENGNVKTGHAKIVLE